MEIKFDILSYCSENYKDAYDFVINSWLNNSGCDNIYIYTDSNIIKSIHPKVKIIKLYDSPNDNWLIGTGRRIDIINHFIDSKISNKFFCFFDIDCYVVKPFTEIFEIIDPFFDIAITRLFPREDNQSITATAGLFFMKNNDASKIFIKEWKDLAEKYKKEKKGVKEYRISFAQYSFTRLVQYSFDMKKPYKVYVASEKIYNSENSNKDKWIQEIAKYKPKILHFKGRGWRNKDLVKKAFNAMK